MKKNLIAALTKIIKDYSNSLDLNLTDEFLTNISILKVPISFVNDLSLLIYPENADAINFIKVQIAKLFAFNNKEKVQTNYDSRIKTSDNYKLYIGDFIEIVMVY